jgi:hypothetical protein
VHVDLHQKIVQLSDHRPRDADQFDRCARWDSGEILGGSPNSSSVTWSYQLDRRHAASASVDLALTAPAVATTHGSRLEHVHSAAA